MVTTHLRALKNRRRFENRENQFYDSGKNVTAKSAPIVMKSVEISDIHFLVRRRGTTIRHLISKFLLNGCQKENPLKQLYLNSD